MCNGRYRIHSIMARHEASSTGYSVNITIVTERYYLKIILILLGFFWFLFFKTIFFLTFFENTKNIVLVFF